MASPFSNYNSAQNNPNSWASKAQAPTAAPQRAVTVPNWGSTFLNDLIVQPNFQGSVLEEFFERSQFVSSGIISRNSAMDMSGGGTVVQVPFFKAAELEEEEIDSSDDWGQSGAGYLSPQKIGMSSYQVPVIHRGWAGAADDISRLGSGEDPLGALRSYTANNMAKFRQNYLLDLLGALFDTTNGALKTNGLDVSLSAAATAGNAVTLDNQLTSGKVIALQNILGERGGDLSVIAMHSAVYNELKVAGLLTFSSPQGVGTTSTIQWGGGGLGVSNTEIAFFAGMRIVVSDQLVEAKGSASAGDAMTYPCYVFGPGSVQEGVQSGLRIETERNILSKQDIFSVDYHYLLGVPGISWVGTPANGKMFPAKSDIKIATNWQLQWAHNEFVPLTRILVNSTFGGVYA